MRQRITVNPDTDPAWADLIANTEFDSLFASPLWIRAVASSYGLEPRADLLLEGGRPRAGIAYATLNDARGERTIAFPFADYCDPVAENLETWHELIEPIVARGSPISVKVLRSSVPLGDERFVEVRKLHWHRTAIAADEDEQWGRLGGSARRNIAKARGKDLAITCSRSLGDLRAFYEMHTGVRKRKYRLLPQPWRFFEELHQAFGAGIHVLLARQGDEVAGGVVLVEWGDTLYYKFNASNPAHLEFRPNDLLAWETLRLAQKLGLRWVDWGVSDDDQPGLIRYKEKFASERHDAKASNRV
jgi:CelD/BcsL family acetyltransferase involved in cellulose biosynthesis